MTVIRLIGTVEATIHNTAYFTFKCKPYLRNQDNSFFICIVLFHNRP